MASDNRPSTSDKKLHIEFPVLCIQVLALRAYSTKINNFNPTAEK